jgi:hypothetical protein
MQCEQAHAKSSIAAPRKKNSGNKKKQRQATRVIKKSARGMQCTPGGKMKYLI